jgi:hypothetical protein
MIRQDLDAYTDIHPGGPGTCTIRSPNLTITLPTWTNWPEKDSITVKDVTGANPDCMIVAGGNGLIDGKLSVTLTQAHGSMTFAPSDGGNNWTVA